MVSLQPSDKPHTATTHSLHQWDQRENLKVKDGKFMDWDKDSLIGRAKATHTSKTKQKGTKSLPP